MAEQRAVRIAYEGQFEKTKKSTPLIVQRLDGLEELDRK